MPGGRVERGEDLLSALMREVAEETGLVVTVDCPIGFHSKNDGQTALIVIFKGKAIGGVLRSSEESTDVGWFAPEEALKLVTHPAARDRLCDALSYSGRVIYRSYTISSYRSNVISY